MQISIVLATYNGGLYLQSQLDSIRDQSLLPTELIITDDGSTDETLEIAHAFAKHAPFSVEIHLNKNTTRGYLYNFMSGVTYCSGDLIAFCDQDDVWFPNKLERMVPVFDDPNVLMAYHNALITDESLRPIRRLCNSAEEQQALSVVPMHPWHLSNGFTQVFRASLRCYDHLWPSMHDHNKDKRMGHDQWYSMLALMFGGLVYVDENLAFYRQHSQNVVGARAKRTFSRQVKGFFNHSSQWEQQAGRSAADRAELAKHILARGDCSPQIQLRLQQCEEAYRLLAQRLARRAALYEEKSRWQRATTLLHLLRHGDYSSDRLWKFSWSTFPRDLVLGLINHVAQ